MPEVRKRDARWVCTRCGFDSGEWLETLPPKHRSPFHEAGHTKAFCTFQLKVFAKKQVSEIAESLKVVERSIEVVESRLADEKARLKFFQKQFGEIASTLQGVNDSSLHDAIAVVRDRSTAFHAATMSEIAAELEALKESRSPEKKFYDSHARTVEDFETTLRTITERADSPKLAFEQAKNCDLRHPITPDELELQYVCAECKKPVRLIENDGDEFAPTVEAHFSFDDGESECFNSRAKILLTDMHNVSSLCRVVKMNLPRIREVNDGVL
jgi:hypothetical protein